MQLEIANLEKEKVHFDGSVKSLTNINQNLCNSMYVKGHQNDELDITIQAKEARSKELTQSTLQMETIINEASLIAAFLVLPKGLDDSNLDKLVGLMVALRQKRLGSGSKQIRDAEGNVICQCPVPVVGNIDAYNVDYDKVRETLALHLIPLVKDKFVSVIEHNMDVIERLWL